MKYFIYLILFLLIGCSQTVSGVDKDYYKQSEKYAHELYKITKNKKMPAKDYGEINDFLDESYDTDIEGELNHSLTEMYAYYGMYLVDEVRLGEPSEDTLENLERVADTLEEKFNMDIR